MASMVWMMEVSGVRIQSRPRLGWMVGKIVDLGRREMKVEVARQCVKDRMECRALVHMQMIECKRR